MPEANAPDLKYWLGFNMIKGIGPAKIRALIDHFGGLPEAWNANESQLQRIGIDRRALQSFLSARAEMDLDAEMARVEAAGIEILVWDSPEYPRYLKEIPGPPPVLYINGDLKEIDQWAVAVVGTRRFTTYGRQITQELVSGLVRSEVTIVSGLAKGIDAVAHKTALDMGGRTMAILGSGLDNIYPPENRALAARIMEGNGALMSEYALGVKPDAKNFPPRNRVISGLSLGVVVVEAGERSGASITAGFALEQGRDVFAVPGNVNSPASAGTNRLIQQGAKLVASVGDILEELNLTMIPEQTAVQLMLPESAEEALIISHLSHQPTHIDELTQMSEMSSAEISSTLTLMELKGMVHQVGGMNYVLAREPEPIYEVVPEEQQADEQ
jgi:DNA processing protein